MEKPDVGKRQFLRWISGVGVVGVAGCSGGGDGGNEPGQTDKTTSVVDTTIDSETTTDSETSDTEVQSQVQLTTKLGQNLDIAPEVRFGGSLSIDGDTALISSRNKAYVFQRSSNEWPHTATLTPDANPQQGSPAVGPVTGHDDTALVGAPDESDANGKSAGAVFVFERTGNSWNQQRKFTADDTDRWDAFGSSVVLDNDTALVGAFNEGDTPEDAIKRNEFLGPGAAYVFRKTGEGWRQEAKLTADDGEKQDWFGWEATIEGDTAVVGAPKHPRSENPGAAYVFEREDGKWTQQTRLSADDVQGRDLFGWATALYENTLLIGAWDTTVSGGAFREGLVYIYDRKGGTWQQQTIVRPEEDAQTKLGSDVAIDGDIALIGDMTQGQKQGRGVSEGAVYVYDRSPVGWSRRTKIVPEDISGGYNFGMKIALDNTTALISTFPGDEPNEVYVYEL